MVTGSRLCLSCGEQGHGDWIISWYDRSAVSGSSGKETVVAGSRLCLLSG